MHWPHLTTALLTEQNAFLAIQWLIRVIMLIVVPFRRTPAAAKAWLMLIFFQPLIGLGLYLIFGRAIQPRWLQARRRKWEACSKPSPPASSTSPNSAT